MKKNIHPAYRFVMFRDVSCGFEFLTRSCMTAKGKGTWEGKEVALAEIDISSQSHPFFTGTQKIMDTEGRVDRYYRKYGFQQADSGDES